MRVNSFQNVVRSHGFRLTAAIAMSLCAMLLLAAFVTNHSGGVALSKKVNIAMRAIGHDLLLRAGDSTSTVPPVFEKSTGVFVLKFQNEFVFQPDTLVAAVQRNLAKTGLSRYTTTVYECYSPSIVYGFEINPPDNSIKPCRGRTQPRACYIIEIAFSDFPNPTVIRNPPIAVAISGILSLMAIVLIGKNLVSRKSTLPAEPRVSVEDENNGRVTIGRIVFDAANQVLTAGDENISLTDKECRILTLLHRNIGRLTLRDELIQEVWTDEGVITGRSLDMFISKLRKKLSADPDVRITNIHGKGYKLEVVTAPIA
jgi:DNA-binding winged helix-turn-helix (wHTH) protein